MDSLLANANATAAPTLGLVTGPIRLSLTPLLLRNSHPTFEINSQSVGDTVDVVEVTDDLGRDCYLLIAQTNFPQLVDVCLGHFPWRNGQCDCVLAERLVNFVESAIAKIENQFFGCILIPRLLTEVACVGKRSVKAIVDIAHHCSEHLSLRSRERVCGFHEGNVEAHRSRRRGSVLAHDLNDVGDAARPSHCGLIKFLRRAGGIFDGDLFDICHVSTNAKNLQTKPLFDLFFDCRSRSRQISRRVGVLTRDTFEF